jgi:DNA-binding transcriptional regulator YhcF (GntR family)|tara:strand:- start:1269 stop:1610 length:342 start_codon:yes stop_codon:yes gene_type:complete
LQIIPSISIIEENDRKQIYLQILSDQFCMKIISCIIDDAKTAVQIAKETNIPISTIYRRLQFLQENKTVKISGGINKDGKFFMYRSKLRAISTSYDGTTVRISVTPNLNFTIK